MSLSSLSGFILRLHILSSWPFPGAQQAEPYTDQSLTESGGVELGAGAAPEGCSEHMPNSEESGSWAENTCHGSRTTLSLVLAVQQGPVDSHGEFLHGHVLLCLSPLFCVPFGPGASGGLQGCPQIPGLRDEHLHPCLWVSVLTDRLVNLKPLSRTFVVHCPPCSACSRHHTDWWARHVESEWHLEIQQSDFLTTE